MTFNKSIKTTMGASQSQTNSHFQCILKDDSTNKTCQLSLRSQTFMKLPSEVLLHLLKNVDVVTLINLSLTCSYFNQLCNENKETLFKLASIKRYCINPRQIEPYLRHSSTETSWKELYLRLNDGLTTWKGFAIDRATNNFQPYPMSICFKAASHRKRKDILSTEVVGVCKWSTLRNSLTLVRGIISDKTGNKNRYTIDSFLGCSPPRLIKFVEERIIRGEDIAIPNTYCISILI